MLNLILVFCLTTIFTNLSLADNVFDNVIQVTPIIESANNGDSYDTISEILTIPLVNIGGNGGTFYSNVRITVASIVAVNSVNRPPGGYDTFDPDTNRLGIPTVTVGNSTYSNVYITVGKILSIGSSCASAMACGVDVSIATSAIGSGGTLPTGSTGTGTTVTSTDRIMVGGSLTSGQRIVSPNGQFQLILQPDGNLCGFKIVTGTSTSNWTSTSWCSMVMKADTVRLTSQGQIQLVSTVACPGGSEQVMADSKAVANADSLRISNTGSVALYTTSGSVVWSTATGLTTQSTNLCWKYPPVLHPDPTKRSTALSAPPTSLGTYYKKYYNAQGLNIVGTASTSDISMNIIYKQIDNMISAIINPADRAKFSGFNVIVMSKYDDQTKMPLMSMISTSYLQTNRTFSSPVVSLIEENLCQVGVSDNPTDKLYRGMDTPVHEFGHMIAGVLNLYASYNSVIAVNNLNPDPTWPNNEYWAVAVQDWYSQDRTWLWDSSIKWFASTTISRTRADLMTRAPAMYTYMKSLFAIDDSKYLVNCSDFGLPMK
jgi:hypothetical protein